MKCNSLKTIAFKNAFILVLLGGFISRYSFAEIASNDITGLYDILQDEKKYLSPVIGFNWFKTKIIEHMYRLGDDQSPTIQLIKELFYLQPDDVTFDTTTLKKKPAAHFTVATIGKLLNVAEQYQTALSDEQISALQNQFLEIIKAELSSSNGTGSQAAQLAAQLQIVNTELKKLKQDKADKAAIKQKEEQENRIKYDLRGITNLPKLAEPLAQLLVLSLNETLKGTYSPYTFHSILLGFAWKKADLKEEFANLFNQFSPAISKDSPESILSMQAYTTEQARVFIDNLKQNPNTDSLLQNYELGSYASFLLNYASPLNANFPVVQSIGNSLYIDENGIKHRFSNCGEASLRNFFNVLIYNKQTYTLDITILEKLAGENGLTLNPKLVEYFKKYNQISHINTNSYHNEWNQVVSAIPGVEYVHTNYEISTTAGMLRVLNYLLFGDSGDFSKLSMKDQFTFLMQKISRPNEEFSYTEVENHASWNVITLDVNINTKPLFRWTFLREHFEFELISSNRNDDDNSALKLNVLNSTIRKLAQNSTPLDACNLLAVIGQYQTMSIWSDINTLEKLSHSYFYTFFMSIPDNQLSEVSTIFITTNLHNEQLKTVIKNFYENWERLSDYERGDLILYAMKYKAAFLYPIIEKIPLETINNSILAAIIEEIINTKLSEWYPLAKKAILELCYDTDILLESIEQSDDEITKNFISLINENRKRVEQAELDKAIQSNNFDDLILRIIYHAQKNRYHILTEIIEKHPGNAHDTNANIRTVIDKIVRCSMSPVAMGTQGKLQHCDVPGLAHIVNDYFEKYQDSSDEITNNFIIEIASDILTRKQSIFYPAIESIITKSNDSHLLQELSKHIQIQQIKELYPALCKRGLMQQSLCIISYHPTQTNFVYAAFVCHLLSDIVNTQLANITSYNVLQHHLLAGLSAS